VGYWYEAALPGREAFCMRDVSHQSIGAETLGEPFDELLAVTRAFLAMLLDLDDLPADEPVDVNQGRPDYLTTDVSLGISCAAKPGGRGH